MGHEVRVIPPAYVKPFVKRQANDAAHAKITSFRRKGKCGTAVWSLDSAA